MTEKQIFVADPVSYGTAIKPQARKLHDPDVSFEEYHYYALRTREEEKSLVVAKTHWKEIVLRQKPSVAATRAPSDVNISNRENRNAISDREWTDASRAFRTASWGACFYLIVSLFRLVRDVLGRAGC